MVTVAKESQAEKSPKTSERVWSPHIWDGMSLPAWLRLFFRNRGAIGWQFWYFPPILFVLGIGHSLFGMLQQLLLGRRIKQVEFKEPPVFILGHWRSGTTLLHELMVQDSRHTFPTTWECFAPHHFLLTERFARRWLRFLMPARRPMDNMQTGWERPQEDEFALCNLGLPSPYLTIAFPNHPPHDTDYLSMETLSPQQRSRWKQGLLKFLQGVAYRTPKRIVLKSPPHTARIKVLLEMFPDARFVHIIRDPFVLFASTVNLWKRLYEKHGLQKPTFKGLEEYVFTTFMQMYDAYERQRALIPPSNLIEIRYEELTANPMERMQAIYQQLDLGDFEQVRPAMQQYLDDNHDYQTNRYQLQDEQRRLIAERWGKYIERFGYSAPVNGER